MKKTQPLKTNILSLRIFVQDKQIPESLLILGIMLLALLIRLPYWETIPAAGDETIQAFVANRIANGEIFPLVGNDAYAGPFFFYLLAAIIHLGVQDPLIGRFVILLAGTLTAPLTYLWVRELFNQRSASLIAALLVVVNPHMILLNSHVGGTTFLMPFFTTLFLWVLTTAVNQDSYKRLIFSSIIAGIAIQTNPIAALIIGPGLIWASIKMKNLPRMGKKWPVWSLITGLIILVVYSPVIIYNIEIDQQQNTLNVLNARSYLWEENPTIHTFFNNLNRLMFQFIRQMSGILVGDENINTILGVPMLYMVWMILGMLYTTRKCSRLPLILVLPFIFLLPFFSSHYGLIAPVRFTTLVTPIFAAGMGIFSASTLLNSQKKFKIINAFCLLLLMTYPVKQLYNYYGFVETNLLSGESLLKLSREIVETDQGFPTFISNSPDMPMGSLYLPSAYLAFNDMYQEVLPVQDIVIRLFSNPDGAYVMATDSDLQTIQSFAQLIPWPSDANKKANLQNYGLYSLDLNTPMNKPDFVYGLGTSEIPSPDIEVNILFDKFIQLLGISASSPILPGNNVEVFAFWQKAGESPMDTFISFAHIVDTSDKTIIVQDDHQLAQQIYPVSAWQYNEIVIERYLLEIPEEAPGNLNLVIGIYNWPTLNRLEIPRYPNNAIEFHIDNHGNISLLPAETD